MSYTLPNLGKDNISKRSTIAFGGYTHTISGGDGTIYDMTNLTSDYYPVLSPRAKRYLQRTIASPQGIYVADGLWWVANGILYKDGEQKATGLTATGEKIIVGMTNRIIIFPDKMVYNTYTDVEADKWTSLESDWEIKSGSIEFRNGKYAGEDADANTIYYNFTGDKDWNDYFKVGDAVTIAGCTIHTENNKTPIIREIGKLNDTDEKDNCLRFYENVFTLDEQTDDDGNVTPKNYTETASEDNPISLKRTVPDLDFVCENDNRLWGCSNTDNTIYASKLGDPTNWNVYDGISTDSYYCEVGSSGKFTACVSYLGYPLFFKEDHIYKMYGDYPSAYQLIASATLGVADGSYKSLAIAGETLYYLSKTGVVRYTGGIPSNISSIFGTDRYENGCAGTDGTKYYISMKCRDAWNLFVYDTRYGLWHREDATHVIGWAANDELYYLDSDGNLMMTGNIRTTAGTEESDFESICEFGDFIEGKTYYSTSQGNPSHKAVSKIQLRIQVDDGATVEAQIQYDSSGTWKKVSSLSAGKKRNAYLAIIPKRCDHFKLRLVATGNYKLYSLVREEYTGSDLF